MRSLRPLIAAAAERLLRLALPPGTDVTPRPPAVDLGARTDELNAAAERYYAARDDRAYQLGKPFSDPFEPPQYLFNAGTLLHWLRVGPGDTVAEIGAGAGWLSHFLNLYGCRTLAIDVSASALALGRERFAADPRTQWDLDPAFLVYDGRVLPAADASCDRIVLHDAFHHLPNAAELVAEMARILAPGGIVAMSEPGRFHSQSEGARAEVEDAGVLENDVVVEDLAVLARRCGFSRVTVVPITLRLPFEVEAEGFVDFLRGDRLLEYWQALGQQLLGHHYILLYKGEPLPTTRRPGLLRAELRLLDSLPAVVSSGERVPVRIAVRNAGDTLWLCTQQRRAGWARLGAHLETPEEPAGYLNDWLREELPRDLAPGEAAEAAFELTAPVRPGRYRIVFDLVAEQITWFAERGSTPLTAEIRVIAPAG